MKYLIAILSLYTTLMACHVGKPSPKELVTQYYQARDSKDFRHIKSLINDSLTITAGDFVMPYTPEGFYQVFKWDSVFNTSYEVLEMEEKDRQVMIWLKMGSDRHAFLGNDPMLCQYRISMDNGKISKIEELNCPEADWTTWQTARDTLVAWTKKNHPQLDGFINDMTMKGAQNYHKAIELYKTATSPSENREERP